MKSLTLAEKIQSFYKNLILPSNLPIGINTINPYVNEKVEDYFNIFLNRYFSDKNKHVLVLGINPGRFGSGVTGVPFTDPIALAEHCKIENELIKRHELSSEFIYSFIEEWGGAKKFYKDFFLTAVSPIGFTKNNLNYNYYDDLELFTAVKPFIFKTLKQQHDFGVKDTCILLGTGKNQKIFTEINNELALFKKVYAVEHPRYIMQYQRKNLQKYIDKYKKTFSKALSD